MGGGEGSGRGVPPHIFMLGGVMETFSMLCSSSLLRRTVTAVLFCFFLLFAGIRGALVRGPVRVSLPPPRQTPPGAESGDAGPYAATAAAAKSCRMHSEIRQREMMTVKEEEEERERHEGKAINGRRGRNKRGPRRNW